MNNPTDSALQDDAEGFRAGFTERLRWLLDRYPSRLEAAQIAGVGANQLSRYLRGVDPAWEVVARLAKNRGVSLDWLLTGGESASAPGSGQAVGEEGRQFYRDYGRDAAEAISIPLFDIQASAGGGQLVWDEQPTTRVVFPRAMLHRMGINPRGAKLLLARGDSMEPTVGDGSLMLVDTADIDLRDDIFVLRREESILVKRLQRHLDGSLAVRSDNPAYQEDRLPRDEAEDLQIIGRVRMVFKAV